MNSKNEIRLRAFQDGDMERFKTWLYTPHVAKWYREPEEWLSEVENRGGGFSFVSHFIAELENEPVGFCQFYDYSAGGENWEGTLNADGAYSIDYLIGDEKNLAKGFGKQIVSAMTEMIRALGAKRIIVQPERENKASRALLRSCGFSYSEENDVYVLEL